MRALRIVFLSLPLVGSARAATNDGVNAADVYRPVFSNVAAWSRAHPQFRNSYSNVTGPDAAKAYADLVPQLSALDAAEEAVYVDWGTRYEDGAAAALPHISPAMTTARAANWAAHYALSNNLPGFGRHALEALRVARNVGEEQLLINLLVQISAEKPALDLLASHLDRLDAQQLATLDASLKALPPGGTLVDAMQMEKALFVDQLIRQLMKAMREADTNLFELAYAPEAGSATDTVAHAGAGERTGEAIAPSWITENLRLTSIVDAGRGWKIGFETKDGDQFQVALGRPARGIELLSVDYEREEAVVSRGKETALVKLKSREIQPLRLRFRWPSAEEFKTLQGDAEKLRKNPVLALMTGFEVFGGDGKAREEFIKQTGGTPEGLLALLARTSGEYEQWIDAFKRLSPTEFSRFHAGLMERGTILTKQMLPAVDKVIEKEAMLRAAQTRLAEALAARIRR